MPLALRKLLILRYQLVMIYTFSVHITERNVVSGENSAKQDCFFQARDKTIFYS